MADPSERRCESCGTLSIQFDPDKADPQICPVCHRPLDGGAPPDSDGRYLAAARAYCKAKFTYSPEVYADGEKGVERHLDYDARSTADEPWLRAVVAAAVADRPGRALIFATYERVGQLFNLPPGVRVVAAAPDIPRNGVVFGIEGDTLPRLDEGMYSSTWDPEERRPR